MVIHVSFSRAKISPELFCKEAKAKTEVDEERQGFTSGFQSPRSARLTPALIFGALLDIV